MKINLPKHTITSRVRSQLQGNATLGYLGLKEIPLAYINFDNVIKNPRISVREDFMQTLRRTVRPYDSFSKPETYLFDSDNNLVRRTMKRIGDQYYYEPENQKEFTPLNFNVYLEVQRQQQYYNDRIYDIKATAIESANGLSFVYDLMNIFGDSYRRGVAPANIRFNGGSTNVMSLLENSAYESDFVFIQSHDGLHYGDSIEESDEININGMLDNHNNVWLFCDTYAGRLQTVTTLTSENTLLHMNSHMIYRTEIYSIPRNQAKLFNQDIGFVESSGPDVYDYEYMNEAVLIIHKRNKGYLIISPDWFLNNLTAVAPIMYETIMKCYLSGYYKSRTLSAWITEQPVDYQSYQYSKFGQTHTRLTLDNFLADEHLVNDEYKIVDIRVTTPYVRYTGLNENNEMTFRKVGSLSDPEKDPGEISFYTTKHTVINYKPEDLALVEEPINLEFTSSENALFLTVHPYVSSKNEICTKVDQTFKMEDLSVDYVLFVGKGSVDIRNTFFLLKSTEQPDPSYLRVADITFEIEQAPEAYDTRIMGGGLPDDQPNDYDMLDIGHIFGRPYRVGSSLVIRLPIKFQNYKERIAKELDKHIAAGDEYVLVFEKQT